MATLPTAALRCPRFLLPSDCRRSFSGGPFSVSSNVRFYGLPMRRHLTVCMASSSAAGSPYDSGEESPYTVLGVSPIAGFDAMKTAYNRKRKDAERRGDEESIAKLERAYDKIMMSQLQNRKKGVTFGSFKVSKDIKFADKEPIVPWGPRYSMSSIKDMRINMAILAVFTIYQCLRIDDIANQQQNVWVLIQRNAEYKPLQFLGFVFFYRIFEKLKAFEPAVSPTLDEYGEDSGKGLRMGKRILRSLGLVFSCIAVSSLGYTGILNLIEFFGRAIPLVLYNNQEPIVTVASSITLYIIASYFR